MPTLDYTASATSSRTAGGQQNKVVQLLIVLVCWSVFQVEETPSGTTAILFTLAVYLVEGFRVKTRGGRQPCETCGRADMLQSAQSRNNTGRLDRTAQQLRGNPPGSEKAQRLSPSRTTRQAANVADASPTAASTTPKTPASAAGGEYLEGVLTRLAGAAELGTDPLIYVRRADVAELVDVLTDLARSPLGPTVTSPALARLTLLRRSRRRDSAPGCKKRVASPAPSSALHRQPDSSRCHGNGHCSSLGRLRPSSASPSASPPRSRVPMAGGRALFQDSDMTPPLRVLTGANPASSKVTFRARSPAGSPRGDAGGASSRRIRGGQDGRQHRLQQRARSRSPSSASAEAARLSSFALSTTPVALDKNKAAPGNAAGGPPVTPGMDDADATSPSTETKKKKKPEVTALLAAMMPESAAKDPTSSELKKIRCVPVKGEGTAFDDFWSSGWG
ncbi:unnamed protein product [Scytosiphon promiscuus]